MRIAFVDHSAVSGGGIIRYGTQLAKAIAQSDKEIRITYFTHQDNYTNNKSLFDECSSFFQLQILAHTRQGLVRNRYLDMVLKKLLPSNGSKKLGQEIISRTKDFDVVYFTCAHTTDHVEVIPPVFGTFHDLNSKYLFGLPLFAKKDAADIGRQLGKWFEKANIIVSTPFIREEILKFYPAVKREIDVVFLPNLAEKITVNAQAAVLKKLHIDKPYILYPAAFMPHKNHNNLFNAFWKLMDRSDLKGKYLLVLSGKGTNHFEYGTAISTGVQVADASDFNIRGLGYLSNEDMDMVIKGASLIISTSLYEAGSGPALDAWINEIPLIMSNIRPHLDQLAFFGIHCNTFDPMDTNDIYQQLDHALHNTDAMKERSRDAVGKLSSYTWADTARHYLDIFKKKSL